MDRTAIDENDDFGLASANASRGVRRRFTSETVLLSVFVSLLSCVACRFVLHASNQGNYFLLAGHPISFTHYQQVLTSVFGISQLCFAFMGVVGIVVSDRWAYTKYPVGAVQRKLFEAAKWTTVTLLLILDAGFLEHAYEAIFI